MGVRTSTAEKHRPLSYIGFHDTVDRTATQRDDLAMNLPSRSTRHLVAVAVLGAAACSGATVANTGATSSAGGASTGGAHATTSTSATGPGSGGATNTTNSSTGPSTSSSSGHPDAGDADAADADAQTTVGSGPVTIVNTGSTNAPGFTITVTPEGLATWAVGAPKGLGSPLKCVTMTGTTMLAAALTSTLFTDLTKAEPFASRHFDQCAKSISFGTYTHVTYAGATIPDIECGSSTDPLAEAVTVDTQNVETAISAACQ
jgi:hypothetical protein